MPSAMKKCWGDRSHSFDGVFHQMTANRVRMIEGKKGFPVLKFHSSNKKQLLAVIKYQLRGAKTLFLRVLTGVTLSVGMNYPELPTTKRRSKHQVKAAKKFYIQLLLQKYKKEDATRGGGGDRQLREPR